MPLINHTACAKEYPKLTSNELCTGGSVDFCCGTAGIPIFNQEFVYGSQRAVQICIGFRGSLLCDNGFFVYTNVGKYIRWIAFKVATNSGP